ncbi:DDE transposase family protein [Streptomyces griseoruber]|uniref:Uncharacterized protein n=1 Tax=Streptomyces griseoruber TaxID=1943 RepID=A0A101SJ45_9ACTN|nr:DDE transposase family protein [Streptomyces griseoruber]KUN75185.1 hypothetical protein AQJ64_43250 [Streptomyces griseoruber]
MSVEAADAPDQLLLHCGAALRDPDRPYRAPSETTVRRVLQRVDGDALDAAISGWLTARADTSRAADEDKHPPSGPVRAAAAVDGKSLRGAIRADGRRVHPRWLSRQAPRNSRRFLGEPTS